MFVFKFAALGFDMSFLLKLTRNRVTLEGNGCFYPIVIKLTPFYRCCGRVILDDYSQFEKRKQDHIELALIEANQAHDQKRADGRKIALGRIAIEAQSAERRRLKPRASPRRRSRCRRK